MNHKKTDRLDERLIQIVPSKRQLAYQQLEFYAFIHFTVNTFTGKEWGDGTESEQIFMPTKLDTRQWAKAIQTAGMRGAILTCKHHDGFCLWPSKYTNHTIANSPFEDGNGDIVRDFSQACREYGLKFGIYLSPWDRNNKTYGLGKEYDDYYIAQLTELLTNYGDIFTVWLDGACGEGANGKKQVYDWKRYYEVIRKLQPLACINVCGPDIRWCGNEAGHTRTSEWSVVPERTRDTEKISENSQQNDNDAFRNRKISAMDEDLGSRTVLEKEEELIWYPAEVNTSIRPGWFYHPGEDEQVKSLEDLISIYEKSVGGNSMFLLNIPPTKEGLIHDNDRKRLEELGRYLKMTYAVNELKNADKIFIEGVDAAFGESAETNILKCTDEECTDEECTDEECTNEESTDKESTDWSCGMDCDILATDSYDRFIVLKPNTKNDTIVIQWKEPVVIHKIVLKEDIRKSQRVESFRLLGEADELLYEGTVIGYKKIVSLSAVKTQHLKIQILDSRKEAYISFVGIY